MNLTPNAFQPLLSPRLLATRANSVRFGEETHAPEPDKPEPPQDPATETPTFYPAKPNRLVLNAVYWKNQRALKDANIQVDIDPSVFETLNALPENSGILLVANHVGSLDRQAMLEFSRQWKRPLITMGDKSAFDYQTPFQRKLMQRMGIFSVAPGQNTQPGMRQAGWELNYGEHPVLIFPEGRESYRNDALLPFFDGASKLGLGATPRHCRPVYIVPLGLQYEYDERFDEAFKTGIAALEESLELAAPESEMADGERLGRLLHHCFDQWEAASAIDSSAGEPLAKRNTLFQTRLLEALEEKYNMTNRFKETDLRVERVKNLIEKPESPDATDLEAVKRLRELLDYPAQAFQLDVEGEEAPARADLAAVLSQMELTLAAKWPPSAMQGVSKISLKAAQPISMRYGTFRLSSRRFESLQILNDRIRQSMLDLLGITE